MTLLGGTKKHEAYVIAAALTISAIGISLDDLTTFMGFSRGFETNPIFPYSLLVIPLFYGLFLLALEKVGTRMIPSEDNTYFSVFMCTVAALAFKGVVNNIFVLNGASF